MEETLTASQVQAHLDLIWILVAASLVLFMQAGFTALESGLTRAKNTINVAMKNITDFIIAVLIYFAVGYALMFGEDAGGWIGLSGFALHGLTEPMDYASFVFQVTFAGTAATIVSGAVAERIRFIAYAIVSVVVSGLIYPISGHWIWGSGGWLAEMGMVDFAGSTVVHSLGGWVGLAGAMILGPRLGRFNADGTINNIPGHSLVLAVIGVLVLWFGWFGFNGGSTLTGNVEVARIIANTLLAAAAGGLSCFLLSLVISGGEVHIEKLLNGVIGGLVGITAGCAVVEPGGAVMVGLTSGVVVYGAEWALLHWLRVDDPVNAIPAHGFCGAWGTLALAFFAPEANLPAGDMWRQAAVQAQGVLAVFAWGMGTGAILFGLLRTLRFLRVDPEGEQRGLNVHEHGASTGFLETMQLMSGIAGAQGGGEGDLTRRVPVEIGSEAGELAGIFNRLLDTYQSTVAQIKQGVNRVADSAKTMHEAAAAMEQGAGEQHRRTREASIAADQLAASADEVARSAAEASAAAQLADRQADDGRTVLDQSMAALERLAGEVEGASEVIQRLGADTENIHTIIETIRSIAEQTNLLALNAAIEAARAGDQGRGFAVVADEVRQLAQKTQHSTEEIQAMLQRLRGGVHDAVSAMAGGRGQAHASVEAAGRAREALGAIVHSVSTISTLNATIAGAAEEQRTAVAGMSGNIAQVAALAEGNRVGAVASAERSDGLLEVADQLCRLLERFKVGEGLESLPPVAVGA
ncbi:ammonium transporter [Endothiovibrio diazotrophicus]